MEIGGDLVHSLYYARTGTFTIKKMRRITSLCMLTGMLVNISRTDWTLLSHHGLVYDLENQVIVA